MGLGKSVIIRSILKNIDNEKQVLDILNARTLENVENQDHLAEVSERVDSGNQLNGKYTASILGRKTDLYFLV